MTVLPSRLSEQILNLYALRHQPHKKLKHTQTIRRLLPTNCLSVFDYFIGLVLKVLSKLFMTCKLTILQTLNRQA